MTIRVTCENGHSLRAEDGHAGRPLKCPECGVAVTVPAVETPASEVFDAVLVDPIEPQPMFPPTKPAQQHPLPSRQSSLLWLLLCATMLLMCLVGLGGATWFYMFRSPTPNMVEMQEERGVASVAPAEGPEDASPARPDEIALLLDPTGKRGKHDTPQETEADKYVPKKVAAAEEIPSTDAEPPATASDDAESDNLEAVIAAVVGLPVDEIEPTRAKMGPTGQIDVTLPRPAASFAIARNGNLVVAMAHQDEIALYPAATLAGKAARPLSRVRVPGKPNVVIFKQFRDRAVIIVGCMEQKHIFVFDAETLALQAARQAHQGVVYLASTASPHDPWVYFTAHNRCGRVHLDDANATEMIVGNTFVSGKELTPAGDGSWVYVRSHETEFTKCQLYYYPRAPDLATRIFFPHSNLRGPCLVPGPYGDYVALGKELYLADFSKKKGELDFEVQCFFPGSPWVAGMSDGQVRVASLNTMSTIAHAAIPGDFPEKPYTNLLKRWKEDPRRVQAYAKLKRRGVPPDLVYNETRLLADPSGERLILAHYDRVVSLPLADFRLPTDSRVAARILLPPVVYAGEPLRVAVELPDPASTCRLAAVPEGMTYANGQLHWTPAVKQVGEQIVDLEITCGAAMLRKTRKVEVRRRPIPCPFGVAHLVLSEDGTRAFVSSMNSRYGQGLGSTETQRLAIIDLVNNKTLVEREAPGSYVLAAIDDHYAYVRVVHTNQNGMLRALRLEDLADEIEVSHPHLNNPAWALPHSVHAVGKNLLRFDARIFRTPGLTPLTDDDNRLFRVEGFRNQLSLDGVLYNEQLTQPVFLNSQGASNMLTIGGAQRADLRPWGGRVPEVRRRGRDDEKKINLTAEPYIHPDIPVVIAVSEGSLAVFDFFQRRPIIEWPIGMTSIPPNRNRYDSTELAAVESRVVLLVRGELLSFPLDELAEIEFREPFHIPLRQSQLALNADGDTTLSYQIRGGQPPFTAKLSFGGGGFSGQTEIDGADPLASFQVPSSGVQEAILPQLRNILRDVARRRTTDAEMKLRQDGKSYQEFRDLLERNKDALYRAIVEERAEAGRSHFKRLTGRGPQGVPVAVSVKLEVTDATGEAAKIEHWLLFDFPRQPLLSVEGRR